MSAAAHPAQGTAPPLQLDGRVLRLTTLRPGRVSRVVWRARFAVEAASGSFERWGVRRGSTVVVRESYARGQFLARAILQRAGSIVTGAHWLNQDEFPARQEWADDVELVPAFLEAEGKPATSFSG